MWVFTRYGFYSAVCARQGDGRHGSAVDPDRVMVRARVRVHLENLRRRFPELLGRCEVQESPRTDYRYRLFADKRAWARVVEGLAEEMDYDNFKAAVARHEGGALTPYGRSLHEVWGVMRSCQEEDG